MTSNYYFADLSRRTWRGVPKENLGHWNIGRKIAVTGVLLHPDGRIDNVTVPKGRWNEYYRTNASFHPIRGGLLIAVSRPDYVVYKLTATNAHELEHKNARTLFQGIFWRSVVSPNGCQLAIVTGAKSNPNNDPSKIQVLDVCNAKK